MGVGEEYACEVDVMERGEEERERGKARGANCVRCHKGGRARMEAREGRRIRIARREEGSGEGRGKEKIGSGERDRGRQQARRQGRDAAAGIAP